MGGCRGYRGKVQVLDTQLFTHSMGRNAARLEVLKIREPMNAAESANKHPCYLKLLAKSVFISGLLWDFPFDFCLDRAGRYATLV